LNCETKTYCNDAQELKEIPIANIASAVCGSIPSNDDTMVSSIPKCAIVSKKIACNNDAEHYCSECDKVMCATHLDVYHQVHEHDDESVCSIQEHLQGNSGLNNNKTPKNDLLCSNTHLHADDKKCLAAVVCMNCNYKPICAKCITFDKHTEHSFVDIAHWHEHLCNRITTNVEQAKKRLPMIAQEQGKIKDIQDHYKYEHKKNKKAVLEYFGELQKVMVATQVKTMNALDKMNTERVKKANTIAAEQEYIAHIVKATESLLVDTITNSNSLAQASLLFQTIDKQLQVCNHQIPMLFRC